MKNAIYFIGGASASGKSTVASRMAERDALPVIELDRFYDLLSRHLRDREVLASVTERMAREVATQLLRCNALGLLEGGWIYPARARKLQDEFDGRFCPVYCGYPRADAKERLTLIKHGDRHWLTEESKKTAVAYLQEQIEESRWYQKECQKYALPFFDFSSIEEGAQALERHYQRWRRSLGAVSTPGAPASRPSRP